MAPTTTPLRRRVTRAGGEDASPGADGAGRPRRGDPAAGLGAELAAAFVLLAGTVLAGAYLAAHPGPTVLDRIFSGVVPARHRAAFLVEVTRLASPSLVLAVSLAAFVMALRRDRARALAAVMSPWLAVAACEWVLKPMVGRRLQGVLSFPSGTVAVVAATAVVAVLVTPDRLRPVAATVGGVATAAMVLAVIALRWHYPTDALGGVGTGAGVALLADVAAHRIVPPRLRPHRADVPPPGAGPLRAG